MMMADNSDNTSLPPEKNRKHVEPRHAPLRHHPRAHPHTPRRRHAGIRRIRIVPHAPPLHPRRSLARNQHRHVALAPKPHRSPRHLRHPRRLPVHFLRRLPFPPQLLLPPPPPASADAGAHLRRGHVLPGKTRVLARDTHGNAEELVLRLAAVDRRASTQRVNSYDSEVCEEGRGMAEALGGESERELDYCGPHTEACGERIEPEGGVGTAALADAGGRGGIRGGDGGGAGGRDGEGAVPGEGHVLRESWRGVAREGGEFGDGGHGGEASEWEGECGDSAESHGERREEESGSREG
ncbi:hypothetical protein HKD37_11G031545 [Glycine soja]